jgi:hypothetical protein
MVYYSVTGYNKDMFLVGILSWWYKDGILNRIRIAQNRLVMSADLFSIKLLIRTLFNPFRQISADTSGSSFPEKFRAFFDRLLSRVIGAVARSFMVIFGSIVIFLQVIFEFSFMIFWLLMPILPILGAILMALDWKI